MARVIVVGSYNTDLAVGTPRFPRPGETVLGGDLRLGPGGKGSNQAIAAARLGAGVHFIGRVGKDQFGREALATLTREGIDTSFMVADAESPTGAAVILVAETGENEIVVASGANRRLSPADVERASAVFTHGSVFLAQLEVPVETVVKAAEVAKGAGSFSILNPAPADPDLVRFLPLFDLVTPNETEAGILAGMAVESRETAEEAGRRLVDLGARAALVTLGRKGSVYVAPGRTLFTPALTVRAIDTTGAGDAFNGALAVALARGDALDQALRFASAAAALSVTRPGTANSLPNQEEVTRFLAGNPGLVR